MIKLEKLKRLLPVWYEGLYETEILMNTEDSLFENLFNEMKTAQNNQYVSTADVKTISIYEQMLKITVKPGDTLAVRRFRVLTRLTTQKPYTKKYLAELLSSFGDPVTLEVFYNEYRLLIHSHFEKFGQMDELDYLIRTIVPVNMLTEINNELLFNLPAKVAYLAAGLTINHLVIITQDFIKDCHSTVMALGSAGLSINQEETLTLDFQASSSLANVLSAGVGMTPRVEQQITADFVSASQIDNLAMAGTEKVIQQIIEIY